MLFQLHIRMCVVLFFRLANMYSKNVEHSTSVSTVQPLPRLGTASSRTVKKEYKSGASYKGQLQGNKRGGSGVFKWPNGAVYDGEFVDNQRHGIGEVHALI